jgi:hypothetical protein
MPQAAVQRKQQLILVSEDYDPDVWRSLDEEETEFESWAAVAQDIWGRGCFLPGQAAAAHEGAAGLTINKTMIVGAVGCAVGGVGRVAIETGTYIEVLEGDPNLLTHELSEPGPGSKFLKPEAWDPAKPALRAGRYHALMALRALSVSPDPVAALKAIAAAVKPAGRLFIDELYAPDPSVAALVAQSIAGPTHKLTLHAQAVVTEALETEKFEPRAKVVVNDQVKAAIRTGLAQAVEIAQRLKAIPQPFRRQRMSAFADELQRAAVLHHAIEKGLVTAMRTLHYKPQSL